MSVAVLIFLGALGACAYVYFLYPAMIFALARLRPRPVARGPVHPRLSVIIPAFNEADVIQAKIHSTLANGYPGDLLEVIVASDGSTDQTVALARGAADTRVRVLDLPRRGKVLALNDAVEQATGEILVFTDADVVLEARALEFLVESFADPTVGGVTGRKVQVAPDEMDCDSAQGEGLYVRYEEWVKEQESVFGSAVAAHGALHAIRRSLFHALPDPTVADDMAISMQVVLQGYRLTCEPRARARVAAPVSDLEELRRKVRIANQVIRALRELGGSLFTEGFYSVQLLSHKLLRYLVPVFLLAMMASGTWLAAYHPSPVWDVLWALQGTFYAMALMRAVARASDRDALRGFSVPYYFVLVNAAALMAVISFLRGHRGSSWAPRGGFQSNPSGP